MSSYFPFQGKILKEETVEIISMNYAMFYQFKIQQFNRSIQMINYFGSLASPISMQIMINKEAIPIFNNATGPGNRLIQFVRWALTQDFNRYQSQINAKIMFQELSRQQLRLQSPLLRSYSQPLNLKAQKPSTSLNSKPNQKKQPIRNNLSLNPQILKIQTVLSPQVIPVPLPQKQPQILPSVPLGSFKIKKKIHKFPDIKKDQLSRIPRISMIQTAQMGRSKLNDREKKRMRERLLMRRVYLWNINSELKRDRRQLRALQ